jgi:hypothetical protein
VAGRAAARGRHALEPAGDLVGAPASGIRLADGSHLMGVELPKVITLRLPAELYEEVREQAHQERRSMNGLLLLAVEEYLAARTLAEVAQEPQPGKEPE